MNTTNMEGIMSDYIIPWAMNMGMAVAIFIIGRIVQV